MFSVDNFYDYFFATYGPDSGRNLILTFQPHGAKELHNLQPFGTTAVDPRIKNTTYDSIVMHDQEPLFLDYMDTYRDNLAKGKILGQFANDKQQKLAAKFSQIASSVDVIDFLKYVVGGRRPIVCHSEINSADVRRLQESGFLTCYYWWHGMIARDWFRHWQYYGKLLPLDKSQNPVRFLLYSRAQDGTRSYRKRLIEHCSQHQAIIHYRWNQAHVDSSYSAKIDMADSEFGIHLVAETLFDHDKIYLTEKVFKPMVMSQPFILFGPPHSLRYLRQYGFKTFDTCWDESYDHETDHDKRMQKILQVIDTVASMDQQSYSTIYQQCLPIIDHNRRRFFSQAFQDHLMAEMTLNINQCLFEQNKGHQHSLYDKASTDGHDV
jgi:hypothetical protein